MPSSRTIAATLTAVLLLTLSGCAALQGGNGGVDGDAVARETVASLDAVESYTYDSTVTVRRNDSAATIDIAGAVDRADRRLRFRQTIGDTTATKYVIGDAVYVNRSGSWTSRRLGNSTFWSDQLPVGEQRAILAAANVSFEGNTTVAGTDVYELSVNVSDQQFRDFLQQRLAAVSADATFRDVSYTAYVAHDGYSVERMTSNATVVVGGRPVTVSTEMTVDDYGENLTIELPVANASG